MLTGKKLMTDNIVSNKKVIQYLRKDGAMYLMLLLPVCYYLLFHYAPMYGVIVAFKDYNPVLGIMKSEWIGTEIFRDIFKMKEFWSAVKNTLMLNMLNLLFGFPAPILLAIMLNEIRQQKLKKYFQTL